jgi:hypothetical protein
MLEVRADNAGAIALYERFGFERISVRRGYYPGGVDAWVMRLRPLPRAPGEVPCEPGHRAHPGRTAPERLSARRTGLGGRGAL